MQLWEAQYWKVGKGDIMKHAGKDVWIGILCAVAGEFFYGSSYVFTKYATETASAFALLGWRFLLSAVFMTLLVLPGVIKINLIGKKLKPLILVSVFSPALYYIGETLGIQLTTATESGIFLACIPVAALAASTIILKKSPSRIQIFGIIITLVGVLFTVLAASFSASLSVPGYMLLTLGVISYALYAVYVTWASDYTVMEMTYVMILFGAAIYITIAVIEALICGNLAEMVKLPFTDRGFLIAMIYQGIGCSFLAFFFSNMAISKLGVNKAASFIGISTVVSIVCGALVLKEQITIIQIVGALIILLGVYTANAGTKK